MRKVGQCLLAGTMVSALFSPVAIQIASGESALKLAQAPAAPPTPEEQRRRQQQQQQQRQPPPPPQRQAPPPPAPPQAQPPRVPPPQAPAQVPPPATRQPPPQAPAQVPPPTRVPPQAPAQVPPPTRVPPQAPAQVPPSRQPPATAPAQVPPANAPAQNVPPSRQPPATAPAQVPPANAPAQNLPPSRQPPTTAPTQVAPAGPAAPAAPQQRPVLAPPPPLPAPTAAQARPLPATSDRPAAIAVTTPQGRPVTRVDQLRTERHEVREGDRTIIREPDRVIVREANGRAFIRHSDVDRFRYGARDVRVETRGRDHVTTVVLPNGQRVVTVLDSDGRLLRRSRWVDNREVVIIDQRPVAPGYNYFVELPPPIIRIPRERYIVEAAVAPPAMIYETLMAPPVEAIDQPYSLDQVRYSYSLRERMPSVDIDTINFETGSWEVAPDQIERLATIAQAISQAIAANPKEVFLIEGHTDAVGSDVDNLSLSDRRAETVALILSQQFNVPPENLVTQGYGEQYLKIPTQEAERRNRRVTARRITPLLAQQQQ